MARDTVLKLADKSEAGIGPQVGVDEFNGDATQKIWIKAFGARKRAARVAADFGDHIIQRITAVALFVLFTKFFCGALHLFHHREAVGAGSTRQHGEVASHRPALRCIKEPPLHVTANKQRRLRSQSNDCYRQYWIARPDHKAHEGPEKGFAHPAEASVHHTRGYVVPMLLGGVLDGVGHVVRQNEETLHQRGQKNHDHSKGDVGNQVAKTPANGGKAKEGDHGGNGRGEHRQ
mmetsp:Transcript_13731/g.22031  ORF Transcript_13731/g.22031 Transcript_13731/m.22031 type:complete len:233 (+) Transcript_13731:2239-2937(+)